ncbi:MAG: ABC transporter ATP-binding protein [Tissierellia bacterium]|nr:ABC transporter ATP-binding protein [Tissierellia bacterium]
MSKDILLRVRNLHKSFGEKNILKGINFDIKQGEILGLLGPNGVGKSTTIRTILGLYGEPEGEVILKGNRVSSVQDIAVEISYIPDTPVYYDNLTVLENIKLTAMLNKISKKDFIKRMEVIMEAFELGDFLDVLPDKLSKGTKQKLSLACGLIRDFSIMITDEPFNGLDPKQIRILKDIFIEQKKEGRAVIVSTHLLDIAETFCDRYVILYDGKVIVNQDLDNMDGRYSTGQNDNNSLERIYLNQIKKAGGQ